MMGMTIDEAIATIKGERWICCQEKYIEATNLIENVMHKYKKIETIIEMWKEDKKRFTLGDNGSKDEYLRQISEVLEGVRRWKC